MTFEQAYHELSILAQGKYYALRYSEVHPANVISIITECAIYVDGFPWKTAPTWERALELLEDVIIPDQFGSDLTQRPNKGIKS